MRNDARDTSGMSIALGLPPNGRKLLHVLLFLLLLLVLAAGRTCATAESIAAGFCGHPV